MSSGSRERLHAQIDAWLESEDPAVIDAIEAELAELPDVESGDTDARLARVLGRIGPSAALFERLEDPSQELDETEWDALADALADASIPASPGDAARRQQVVAALSEAEAGAAQEAPAGMPPAIGEMAASPSPANTNWAWRRWIPILVTLAAVLAIAVFLPGDPVEEELRWRGDPGAALPWPSRIQGIVNTHVASELSDEISDRRFLVRIAVAEDGSVASVELVLGSGDAEADAALLETLEGLSSLPAPAGIAEPLDLWLEL